MAVLGCLLFATTAWAQHDAPVMDSAAGDAPAAVEAPAAGHSSAEHAAAGESHGAAAEHGAKEPGTFDAHYGTWLNPLARLVFGLGPVEKHGEHFSNVNYDYIVVAVVAMLMLMLVGTLAAKRSRLRPEGKPTSLPNLVEAAVEGYRNYLVGVMGQQLAFKYAPLISSFFFTILFFNWLGLVPGLLAPTANPNIPIALALCAFFCVHFIAIKEAGLKSWFMHFVGEPIWLAPLNFPLHLIGELIKPLSLSIRLLCNVFGEEMVAFQLATLAVVGMAVLHVPLPFHLPMLLLGTFFGLLQALVFSTLLAIYVSILSTHHDDHDEHNAHGHTEHARLHGIDQVVGRPTESTVGA